MGRPSTVKNIAGADAIMYLTDTGSFVMNQTLLIAEDDGELCDVYRRFFARQGWNVETASDALDCLDKLRRVTPAVLMLDLELRWGGADGVLAWLREEGAKPGVPVVLTTTSGYAPDMAAFTEPPVVDYLRKPCALSALLESVRSAVARAGRGEPSNPNHVAVCSELFIG